MSNFKKLSIEEFLKNLSSKNPTPGGGTVAALSGAFAASLVIMVSELTIGKKGYENYWQEMKKVKSEARGYRESFLSLADKDSKAFDKVVESFKISHSDGDRVVKIQKAFKEATEIPLETALISFKVYNLAKQIEKRGNKNAVSDARVSQNMAKAAVLSALENVKINLTSIKDKKWSEKIWKKVAELEAI